MELTWKSTLLLTVMAALAAWWLEQKIKSAAATVVAPVVDAANGAAQADPLAHGSVWAALENAIEIPVGGSSAAVARAWK